MNLNYSKGAIVVVTVFGKHKVGTVVERAISKNGMVHTVESEDGKIYESIYVNGKSAIFINKELTQIFLKSQEDGNTENDIQENKE